MNIILKTTTVLLGLAVLTGCGVDGPPTRPEPEKDQTAGAGSVGVTVSGTASIGVKGGSSR